MLRPFFLLSTLCECISVIFENKPLNFTSGIFHEEIGSLKLWNDEWKLITYLDLENYYDEHKLIKLYSNDVKQACTFATQRHIMVTDCENINQTLSHSLVHTEEKNASISELLGLRSKPVDNKLTFLVLIPLVSSRVYSVEKLSSVPVSVPNSDSFIFILPQSPYLIIDKVKQHYFLMNEIELAECRYIKPFHLCQQSSPIFLVHLHGGCEASLFIPKPNIPLTCDKRIAKINQPLFIQLIQSNTWLYFTPKEENLDVTCRSSNVRESVKIHSSGVFHLNENCSAYGQSIILTSHSTFIREVRVNFTPEIDLRKSLDLNLSFLNTVDIQPLARELCNHRS
ncbi:hypothetical protein HHI36_024182 [Cryptolaemus montrouzieri]|uniref:Envelope fusion protein n=1 Tax=Cryptolaemus montrouzieri TaxID=559131 RepID=A0ABD2MVE4_9CUCU